MATYAQRLYQALEEVVDLTDQLLEISEIEYDPDRVQRMSRQAGVAILMVLPKSFWRPLNEEGRRRQRTALERWQNWLEQARLLFSTDTPTAQEKLEQAAKNVTLWLGRSEGDFSIPRRLEEACRTFRGHVEPLFELLSPFLADGPLVLLPDTNVLLRNQELPSWADALGTDDFTVLLVPGVLTELDEHKLNHRNPDVREKARKFSSRVKGWRKQGSLTAGVRVQGKVFVRVVAREPDFGKTLSWLDPSITDDRIIASMLEFQRLNPATDVRLLSGDSIMLAKADEASLATDDVPDKV